jgi:hypothetical protein
MRNICRLAETALVGEDERFSVVRFRTGPLPMCSSPDCLISDSIRFCDMTSRQQSTDELRVVSKGIRWRLTPDSGGRPQLIDRLRCLTHVAQGRPCVVAADCSEVIPPMSSCFDRDPLTYPHDVGK